MPDGPIADALRIAPVMGIGLEITAEANIFGFTLIDNFIGGDLTALGVYYNWTLSENCVDSDGIKPGQPMNTTAQSLNGSEATITPPPPVKEREFQRSWRDLAASRKRRSKTPDQKNNNNSDTPARLPRRKKPTNRARSAALIGGSSTHI
jgi:hypothetical protein